MGLLPTNPGKPPGPPNNPPNPSDILPSTRGYNKGTSKVPGNQSSRLTAAELAGVPHPVLAQFNKKK